MNVVSLSRYAFGGYMLPCTNVITLVNVGHGFLVCTRIVYGSTISTRSIGAKKVAPRSFPCPPARRSRLHRSEEHTSELQSLAYLVCRLLLEKKKNQPTPPIMSHAILH